MASSTGVRVCRQFSLAEMQLATGGFHDNDVIGKGGFGKVYKGLIDNGSSTVAVKRLASNSKQGEQEFVMEIETLSKLRHPNLVSLIGYCNEQDEMILVYEYMPNKTLADHLHINNLQSSSLTWIKRLSICIGAARGLAYLHGCSVIHRDFKPTNILLDDKFIAKVSDFGLAKHLNGGDLESHVTTNIKGSFGYFDPSYFHSGRLTKASDTFAFGVMMLEVLSGRRAVDSLTMWAQEKIRNGKSHEIVASTLREQISEDCLKTYVGVVERCLVYEPKERLSMTQAVAELELALKQQESRGAMADAAVEFLLKKLQLLLLYHVHLIKDAKEQVEQLERDLRLFKSFLKDSTKIGRRREYSLRGLVCQIRDVVYEAEDAIDNFVTQVTQSRSTNYFIRASQMPNKLLHVAKQVEAVALKVRYIYGDKGMLGFASLNVGDAGPEESEIPDPRQENIVGFEDEAEKLIGYLREETDELDVISILGMPGIGKTTLARKIFHHPVIDYEFPTLVWVYISQDFTKRKVFLDILRGFIRLSDDMHQKSEMELAQLVASHLGRGKFLIVMDDVWTCEDWDKLKVALPKRNEMGKVLITSRHGEVAWHVNRNRGPHNLRFLTQEESWLLLQLEVFGKPQWPSAEFEVHGKVIAEECGRLPLAIVVIGGILLEMLETSNDMSAKLRAWEKVSQSVSKHLSEDPQRRMERNIASSYDKLPFHLKACFLYFGMFPQDYEIPVWKLIRMWIAEGFIQPKADLNLEETAESYLDDLINRNLVTVDKRKTDSRVKTCRIHNMLCDFCKFEASYGRENFFEEIKESYVGGFEPPVSNVAKFRRLCIHSDLSSFVSSKPFGPHVRSFVCFSKEDIYLPAEYCSYIPEAFKLLRVLEVKPVKFSGIPSDLCLLIHLRYITLSFNLGILPAAFSKLWNVETFIVETTSRTLVIEADIWKWLQLRHLKTNASTTLPKGKSSKKGENLQTLGTISPENCTEEVFDKCRNLKALGIRGKLSLLLDGNTGSFDSLGRLGNVERLKLVNDAFPVPPSESRLLGLPPPYQFPPKLRILSLADTFLDWTHMSTLGLLENLEVLKLKDNAFIGKKWIAADGDFRRLEVLHIGRTNLVIWIASARHFPRLRCVELRNCEKLQEIPLEFADIPSFQLLDLYRSEYAAASAKKIQERKTQNANENQQEDDQTIPVPFKLSIFPPANE